jgi:tetratricopeptide (TPR) repeat protein
LDAATCQKLLAQIDTAHRELRNGRRVDAILAYEEIAQRADLDAVIHLSLGRLSMALEGTFQAVQHFQKALANEPDNAQYLGYLGLALQAEGRIDEAIEAFERAMQGDATIPAVLNGLGGIFLNRGDLARARDLLGKAVAAKPGDGAIQTNYALALASSNEHAIALKHAEKGLKLNPDSPNAHDVYGKVLSELGRVDEAVRHFEKSIRQHRHFGAAYDYLARLKKFSAADRAFIDKTEQALLTSMPARDRLCMHFALGKMYDDCEQWDRAFEHYRQANLLKKKDYDIRFERKLFAQIRKAFTANSIEELQRMGSPSTVPIFIVGMPRSGTTLMERMITGTHLAAGAGELQEIPRIAELVAAGGTPRQFIRSVRANLTADNIAKYAADYLRVLRQAGPDATRIVDKLPGNYFYIWLISILFPRATIVFAQRHPLDVCLSCYFQNFTSIHWSDDLQTIAEVYRFHREVMDYWKSVLPANRIVDVRYEQLVEDPEIHGRLMLESCGLEWRGDGLERYRKDQIVRTASVWQARQPIYQSSKMRWKNYAPHLADLARQLADFLQDDQDQLAELGIDLRTVSGIGRLRNLFG